MISASSGGCYLLESAQGQFALMSKREPITRLLGQASTPPALRTQLEAVTSIRDFASRELGLPDNGSYRSYADVGRPHVVWNVVAAPEFSVGSPGMVLSDRGVVWPTAAISVEGKAESFAAELRPANDSTWAWAALPPIRRWGTSTIRCSTRWWAWSDVELAAIVFHELTHQLLYVAGDAPFNEAPGDDRRRRPAACAAGLSAQGREADLADHAPRSRRAIFRSSALLRRTMRTQLQVLVCLAVLDVPRQCVSVRRQTFAADAGVVRRWPQGVVGRTGPVRVVVRRER